MKKYFIIMLLLLSTFAVGCLRNVPEEDAGGSVKYNDISVSEAKTRVDSGEYFILDGRTREEYDAGHIANAILIPSTDISDRLDEIPTDIPILVYCRSGQRSAIVSQVLADNGYTEVYNMEGGITEWQNAGYPVQK